MGRVTIPVAHADRVREAWDRVKAGEEIDAWEMARMAHVAPSLAAEVLDALVAEGLAERVGWSGGYRPIERNTR